MIEHLQVIEHMLTGMFIMVAMGLVIIMLILGNILNKMGGGGQ